MIDAVVFDLDGVLIQTEEVCGGRYDEAAQRAIMGMSAPEWSRFLHEDLGGRILPLRSPTRSCDA